MDQGISHAYSQKLLRQRNVLALVTLALAIITVLLFLMAMARDREIVLQPILKSNLTLSSAGVSREYLEMVTRDTAYLTLNRSPQSLDYWMNAVLEMVHPASFGKIKGELMKIVDDQRGSNIAQFFTLEGMKVDPDALTSDVRGVLHTVVGRQEIATDQRTYRFAWDYTGLQLRLI